MKGRSMQTGDKVRIEWDVPMGKEFVGEVVKVAVRFVDVRFDIGAAGIKSLQRFTRRKDGRYIAAGWHWVVGIPVLVPA